MGGGDEEGEGKEGVRERGGKEGREGVRKGRGRKGREG